MATTADQTAESAVVVSGRKLPLVQQDGARWPIPMAYLGASLGRAEQRVLWRMSDARRLIIGDFSVVMMGDQPRGLYAERAASGVTVEAHVEYEKLAFRWVMEQFFAAPLAEFAQSFVRMQGEEIPTGLPQHGCVIANTDDPLIGYGASVGAMRALAWEAQRGYQLFSEVFRSFERSRRAGEDRQQAQGRVSRLRAVASAVAGLGLKRQHQGA